MKIEDMVTFEVNGRMCVALVRKLTERECFRLMGCNDADIETIANCGVSRSAQYKMAGNSIVVDVLYNIFRTAFIPSERVDCGDLFGASNLIRGEFTKERPLRVATLCSGYDSQFMALERLHKDYPDFHYERVWYAEHDPESNKPDAKINPLGDWTGGIGVDAGATNRKLGSDMADSVTGGGLHGKDLSKADVSVNIYAWLKAQETGKPVELHCAIGDETVDGKPYAEIVEIARKFITDLGGFEKFAEWGLV